MRFNGAMIAAYLCLFQYRWDLGGAGLGPVVRRFEEIRGEIQALDSENFLAWPALN